MKTIIENAQREVFFLGSQPNNNFVNKQALP